LEITSEEEDVPPTKTPLTLHDYIPKGFFGSDSSDDEPAEEEVAQCCMVSWADECEELNAKLTDNIQEVDQVTLWSGRQLQSPESARKGKEKETIPEGSLSLANANERSEERAIPSNSNGKGSSNDVGVTNEPKQNLSNPTPFQIRQGSHKDRVRYDVISHLK